MEAKGESQTGDPGPLCLPLEPLLFGTWIVGVAPDRAAPAGTIAPVGLTLEWRYHSSLAGFQH